MCHATHCCTLEEDFRIYKNTKMFYYITHHQYDSEEDTSPSPCFCLGVAMMFLINSANIETAVTDTFVGVMPAPGDPGE